MTGRLDNGPRQHFALQQQSQSIIVVILVQSNSFKPHESSEAVAGNQEI